MITALLANSNGGGLKATLEPAVTGGVGTTTTKMQLRQEKELVRHGANRIGDGNCFGAPIDSHIASFKTTFGAVVTWSLHIEVWKECKIAVGIGIAISKLDFVPVGFEALDITAACSVCWNYSEKNVISHESVDWFSVTVVAVDPHPKLRSGEVRMRLNQGI